MEPWYVHSLAQNFRNQTTHHFFARSTNQALAMPASAPSLKKSAGTKGPAAEPPPPPAGYTYPADFRFKRCRRCGTWNCSPAPYDQSAGPEHLWGQVVAWEGGSVYAPTGSHCLLCRKARIGVEKWKVDSGKLDYIGIGCEFEPFELACHKSGFTLVSAL